MSKRSLYIETTIPSVITAYPSRDIGNLYRQEITKEFWEYERQKYDLYISQYVWEECERGDEDAAKRRLELIKDINAKRNLWIPRLSNPETFTKFIALEEKENAQS